MQSSKTKSTASVGLVIDIMMHNYIQLVAGVALLCVGLSSSYSDRWFRTTSLVAGVALLCVGFSSSYLDRWFRTTSCPVKCFDIDIKAEEREDRISQLPDDVICYIISRLHTRTAVRTSILSRRWRHVYTLINQVRLYCFHMHHDPSLTGNEVIQRKFAQGVDTFLQHHSGFKVMSFELVCCFRGCILDTFRKWMNSVGTLGVEQLTIGFCFNCFNTNLRDHPVFSTDFLTEAPSVKHLWLWGGSFLIQNKNFLQVLRLDDIAFTSEAVQCMLSNCSSLQSLSLRYCEIPSKLLIHGPDLQLKSLTIYRCKIAEEIDLSAINLINFEIFNDRSTLKLSFSHVPLLQTLIIEFYQKQVTPYVFGEIAKHLPHLESMVFITQASFFESQGWKRDRVVSKLSNLKHLVLILEHYSNDLDLLEVAVFLDACPLLRKFTFSTKVARSTFNLKQAQKRMVGRNTQLKEVEFKGFREKGSEYNFILYMLKNVASLKRLTLSRHTLAYSIHSRCWMCSHSTAGNEERIRKKLQGQAISENVEIITF